MRLWLGVILLVQFPSVLLLLTGLPHIPWLSAYTSPERFGWQTLFWGPIILFGMAGYVIGFLLTLFCPERSLPIGHRVSVSAIYFAILFVIGSAIILPAMAKPRNKASDPSCLRNQRLLGTAMLEFSQDHQGRLPANWQEFTQYLVHLGLLRSDYPNETISPESLLYCPDTVQSFRPIGGYGLNASVMGKSLADFPDPSNTIFSADARHAGQPLHGLQDIDTSRHGLGFIASFLDGHIQGVIPKENWHSLRWK